MVEVKETKFASMYFIQYNKRTGVQSPTVSHCVPEWFTAFRIIDNSRDLGLDLLEQNFVLFLTSRYGFRKCSLVANN